MKQFYLLTLLLSALGSAQSSFNPESFIVSINDIATNTFQTDSTAYALVLHEYGNSYIDKYTYTLKTEIKRKVKILNRNGFGRATQSIYLYNDNNREEKVTEIFATTYNIENGNVTKTELKASEIFKEKYNDKYTIVKFTLPNIQEGSVLTYSYVLESPFIYKYYPWEFQDEIPKLYSEYNTSIPGNYEYSIKLVGNQKLDKNESKIVKHCIEGSNGTSADCAITNYVMTNIPAFIEEDFMTTKRNYLSRLEYELKVIKGFDGSVKNITKTWKDTDKELKTDPNIGRQIGRSTSLKETIANILVDKNDKLAVAKDIYSYVQSNYVWNGEYKIFNDVSVKNLIKTKSGKVSEINLLLHNLLDEYDIEVKPVLLSTRENGLPTTLFPIISEFNYMILQTIINGEIFFLDATDPYLSFGELPFRCLNQFGRVLDFKNGTQWIDIIANKSSGIKYQVHIAIADELIKGDVKANYLGYDALNKKKAFFKNEKSYIEHVADVQREITITNQEVQVTNKNAEDFNESYTIELDNNNSNGGMVYLNPFIYKFFEKNPFQLQQRTYPIDFGYKKSYSYSVQIDFGDAYEVIETPKEINSNLPNNGGEINLKTTVNENSLILLFQLNFKESLYSPEYYGILKAYIAKTLELQTNSLVVLKKK